MSASSKKSKVEQKRIASKLRVKQLKIDPQDVVSERWFDDQLILGSVGINTPIQGCKIC